MSYAQLEQKLLGPKKGPWWLQKPLQRPHFVRTRGPGILCCPLCPSVKSLLPIASCPQSCPWYRSSQHRYQHCLTSWLQLASLLFMSACLCICILPLLFRPVCFCTYCAKLRHRKVAAASLRMVGSCSRQDRLCKGHMKCGMPT